MNLSDTRTRHFAAALFVILLYVLPLIVLGENAFIRTRENIALTNGALYPKVLLESGTLFASSDTIIPQLNMPRLVMGSEFSLHVLLQSLFSTINAYIIAFSVTRIVAFFGMYLLLKRHFLTDDKHDNITIMASMCFALLPFLFYTGISIAGQPLALYSFLNFRKRKQSMKDWLILFCIPFYSSFVLSFLFFLVMVGCIWFYDLVRQRDPNPRLLLAICFMTLVYVGVEYRLFYFMINPFFVSHRHEFGWTTEFNLSPLASIKMILKNIFISQIHARSLQPLSIGISLVLALWLYMSHRTQNQRIMRLILMLTGSIVFLAALKGFLHSEIFLSVFGRFSLIREFNISRFYWLQPPMWHIVFVLSLVIIAETMKKNGRVIIYGLVAIQVIFCFFMSDFYREKVRTDITFRQLFAVRQFKEIKDYIGEPPESYRVISIGLYPAIALYNGFHTADFYLTIYPLEYKHRFRRVIARELDKNPKVKRGYDLWGSIVYAYADEIYGKDNTHIKSLDYNIQAMKDLGIKYVISRVPIDNQFTFMKHFSDTESAWDIYLYEVPENEGSFK